MNDRSVPWTIGDIIIAIIVFFVVVSGGSFILARLLAPTFPRLDAIIVFFLGYAVLAAVVWYFAIIRRSGDWSDLGFRAFNVIQGIGLVVAWFFIVKIISFIYAVIAQRFGLEDTGDMIQRIPETFGSGTVGFLLAVVVVAIIAPIVEELFFRGFIYPVFRQRWGVVVAITVSGLLFALAHASLFLFVPVAVIGFVLAYLYERTESLGPPIMLHALNNFISVVVIYYAGSLSSGV